MEKGRIHPAFERKLNSEGENVLREESKQPFSLLEFYSHYLLFFLFRQWEWV
jgi:hypothetical protein